jgi:hypothetical protein
MSWKNKNKIKIKQSLVLDTFSKKIEIIVNQIIKGQYTTCKTEHLISKVLSIIKIRQYYIKNKIASWKRETKLNEKYLEIGQIMINYSKSTPYRKVSNNTTKLIKNFAEPRPIVPIKPQEPPTVMKANNKVELGFPDDCWKVLPFPKKLIPGVNFHGMTPQEFMMSDFYQLMIEAQYDSVMYQCEKRFNEVKGFSSKNSMSLDELLPLLKISADEALSRSKIYEIIKISQFQYHIERRNKTGRYHIMQVYKTLDKINKEAKKMQAVKLGFDPSTVKSKADKDVEEGMGEIFTAKYKEIADNHDLRVVRVSYTTIEKQILVTVNPLKELRDHFYGMTNITMQLSKSTTNDPNIEFSLDVATMVAYMMIDPDNYSADSSVINRLKQQTGITPPSQHGKIHLTTTYNYDDVKKHDITYLICPIFYKASYGEMRFGIGNYHVKPDGITWAGKGTTKARKIAGLNNILLGDREDGPASQRVYCVGRHQVGAFQIVALTALQHESHVTIENSYCTFEIPVIKDWILSEMNIPTIGYETNQLNRDLLNRLMNRNITLSVSDDSMMEYAMALSWYSYNKRGVELSYVKVTPEIAKTHVYIAKVLLMRDKLLSTVMQSLTTPGNISRTIVAIISATMWVGMQYTGASGIMEKIIEFVTQNISAPNIRNQFDEIINSWDSIDIWMHGGGKPINSSDSENNCIHHNVCMSPRTGYKCKCCKWLTADSNNEYCRCCDELTHVCPHVCHEDEHKGDIKCECCDKLSSQRICDCCSLTMEVQIVGKEKPAVRNGPNHNAVEKPKELTKRIEAIAPAFKTKDMDDEQHGHECPKCHNLYIHEHVYKENEQIDHKEPMHKIHLGACPWCEGSKNRRVVKTTKTKIDEDLPTNEQGFVNIEVSLLGKAEYTAQLSPNTVEYLWSNDNNNPKKPVVHDPTKSEYTTLPFTASGIQSSNNFEVETYRDVTRFDCGYDSLKHYLGITLSETMVKRTINKVENLSTDDLIKIMKAYSVNSVIIDGRYAYVNRCDNTDEFACIIHSGKINGENNSTNHWYVGKLKYSESAVVKPYGCTSASPNAHNNTAHAMFKADYDKLSNHCKLVVSFGLANRFAGIIPSNFKKPSFKNDILSNGDSDKYGGYNFKIPREATDFVGMMLNAINNGDMSDELGTIWDVDHNNINDLTYQAIGNARDACYTIAKMFTDHTRSCQLVNANIISHGRNIVIDVANTKIKDGDVVFFMEGSTLSPAYVRVENGAIQIKGLPNLIGTTFKLWVPKQSFISCIYKLKHCCKSIGKNNYLDLSLDSADSQVISGLAGTGKTTRVAQIVPNLPKDAKVVAIACTRTAVTALLQKLPMSISVMSYEKASKVDKLDCTHLIIDEATMLQPWQIAGLLTKPMTLIVMGDTNQVGGEDFSQLPGTRVMTDLMRYSIAKCKNVETLQAVYRFGNPLASELSKHPGLANLHTKAEHNTAIKLSWAAKSDTNTIATTFATCDVILCFYNSHVEMIKLIMQNPKIRVETVAKYQGLEGKVVGVYQAPIRDGVSGTKATTHLNYTHCVSAATRAVSELKWLSVSCYSKESTLAERLGVTIAGSYCKFACNSEGKDIAWDYTMEDTINKLEETPVKREYKPNVKRKPTMLTNTQMRERMKQTLGIHSKGGKTRDKIKIPWPLQSGELIEKHLEGLTIPGLKVRTGIMLEPKPWTSNNPMTYDADWIDHVGIGVSYTIGQDKLIIFVNHNFYGWRTKFFAGSFDDLADGTYIKFNKRPSAKQLSEFVNLVNENTLPPPPGTIGCWSIATAAKQAGLTNDTYYYDPNTARIEVNHNNKINIFVNDDVEQQSNMGILIENAILYNGTIHKAIITHPNNMFKVDSTRIHVRTLSKLLGKMGIKNQIKKEAKIIMVQCAGSNGSINCIRVIGDEIKYCGDDLNVVHEVIAAIGVLSYPFKFELNATPKIKTTVNNGVNLEQEKQDAIGRCERFEEPTKVESIFKVDKKACIKYVEEKGKENNIKITMNKEDDKMIVKISARKMFITFSFEITLNASGDIVKHNLHEDKHAYAIRAAIMHFSYLPNENSMFEVSSHELNKRGNTRTRVIGYFAKVFKYNQETYTLPNNHNFQVKPSMTGCAACTALMIYNGDKLVATITEDYGGKTRSVVGVMAREFAEMLNSSRKCPMIEEECDDINFSQAILTERVDAWLYSKITGPSTFSTWMRHFKYSNIVLRRTIRNSIDINVTGDDYDDMNNYPFWKPNTDSGWLNVGGNSTSNVSTIVNGERLSYYTSKINKVELVKESLAELQIKMRNNRLSTLISKKYIDHVGASDRLPGMMESFSWHKAHQTQTAHELATKSVLAGVSSLKYEEEMLYVPDDVHNYCLNVMNEKGTSNNYRASPGDVSSQSIDLISVKAIYGDNPQSHVIAHCTTAYLDFVYRDRKITIDKSNYSNFEQITYKLLEPIRNQMFKARMRRAEYTSDEYKRLDNIKNETIVYERNEDNIHYYDANWLSKDPSELYLAMYQKQRVYISCPSNISEVNGELYGRYENSTTSYKINKKLWHIINNGGGGAGWVKSFHITRSWNGMLLITLDNHQWIEHSNMVNGFIIAELPVLITNPLSIIRTQDLLTTRRYAINVSFAQNLMRRAMRPGTTLNDLYIQARTLVNVGQFSTTTVASKYKVHVADAKMMANIAFFTMSSINKKYELLNVNIDDNIIYHSLEMAGKLIAGKAIQHFVGDLTWDNLQTVIDRFLGDNVGAAWLSKFTKVFSSLKYHCLEGPRTMRNIDDPTDRQRKFLESIRIRTNSDNQDGHVSRVIAVSPECPHCNHPSTFEILDALEIKYTTQTKEQMNTLATQYCTHPFDVKLVDCQQQDVKRNNKIILYGLPTDNYVKNCIVWPIESHTLERKNVTNDVINDLYTSNGIVGPRLEKCIVVVNEHTWQTRMALSSTYNSIIIIKNKLEYSVDESNKVITNVHHDSVDLLSGDITAKDFEHITRKEETRKGNGFAQHVVTNKISLCIAGFNSNGVHKHIEPEDNIEDNNSAMIKKMTSTMDENRLSNALEEALLDGSAATREIYRTAITKVFPMAWGENIQWTSGNPHFINNDTTNGGKLTIDEIKFIKSFSNIIENCLSHGVVDSNGVKLDNIDGELVHITVFDKNMRRTLPTHIPGVHFAIVNDSWNQEHNQKHVNYIKFDINEFKRFGAGLRIIFACLLPGKWSGIQFHEARPMYISYIMEDFAYQLWTRDKEEGLVVSYVGSPASCLGHTIWSRKMSINDKAILIKSNLQFGMVYGVDEAGFHNWPVNYLYYNPFSMLSYSNVGFINHDGRSVTKIPSEMNWHGIDCQTVAIMMTITGMSKATDLSKHIDSWFNSSTRQASVNTFDACKQYLVTMENNGLYGHDELHETPTAQDYTWTGQSGRNVEKTESNGNNEHNDDQFNDQTFGHHGFEDLATDHKSLQSEAELEENESQHWQYESRPVSEMGSPPQIGGDYPENMTDDEEELTMDRPTNTEISEYGLQICMTYPINLREEAIGRAHYDWNERGPKDIILKNEIIMPGVRDQTNLPSTKQIMVNGKECDLVATALFGHNEYIMAMIAKLIIDDATSIIITISPSKHRQVVDGPLMSDNKIINDFSTDTEIGFAITGKKQTIKNDRMSMSWEEPVQPEIFSTKAPNVNIVFDPVGYDNCGRKVLEHIMSSNYALQKSPIHHLSPFCAIDDVLSVLNYHGINHCIIRSDNSCEWTIYNKGKIECLKVTDAGHASAWHILYCGQLVYPTKIDKIDYFEKRSGLSVEEWNGAVHTGKANTAELQELVNITNSIVTWLQSSLTTAIPDEILTLKCIDELINAKNRINGRPDIVSTKNGLPTRSFATYKGRFVTLNNARADKIYLCRSATGLTPIITFKNEIGDTVCVRNDTISYEWLIDVGINLNKTKLHKRIINTEIGHLNRESQLAAINQNLPGAALMVNSKATKVYCYKYDGNDHHHRLDRDDMINIVTREDRDLMTALSSTDASRFVNNISHNGPIVHGIDINQLYFTTRCERESETQTLQTFIDQVTNEASQEDQDAMIAFSASWGWRKTGNRLQPKSLLTHGIYDIIGQDLTINQIAEAIVNSSKASGEAKAEIVKHLSNNYNINIKYRIELQTEVVPHNEITSCHETLCATKNSIYDFEYFAEFKILEIGKGLPLDEQPITIDDITSHIHDKVFGQSKTIKTKELSKQISLELTEERESTLRTIDVINDTVVTDWKAYPDIGKGENQTVKIVVGNGNFDCPINVEVNQELIGPNVINYWNDETAMVDNTIPLPKTNINLRGGELITGIREIEKTTLVEYPSHAQPNYTQRAGAGVQAIAELFGSKLNVRTVEHDPSKDADKFMQTYFQKGSSTALPEINIDYNAMMQWLQERPDKTKIAKEVDEILSEGIDINGLDKVNVHLKLESRLKDVMLNAINEIGMPETIAEQRVRLIVWQRKGITAIFAGFFLQIKEALKRVLPENIIYADGMTPAQLSAQVNRISSENITFAEDDLKKQDRQTDMTLIKTEMEIYKRLGANPGVIDIWETVHHNWKAKGLGYKFDGDASRLTGQATTALGNAIVNLMVKERIVRQLGSKLKLMMVLGDDNIMLIDGDITTDQIKLNSARHFNMISEPYVSRMQGTFLRMMVYKTDNGNLELGPDIVRLRRKYEVTNGVSESDDENLIMRKLSYCCMLGDMPETREICNKYGYNVKLQQWYGWSNLRIATAEKYKCSESEIDNELYQLIKNLNSEQVWRYKKTMFVSKMS